MFLLMVLIGIGFGLLIHNNGVLLESGAAEARKPEVKGTVDGKRVDCYIAEDTPERRE